MPSIPVEQIIMSLGYIGIFVLMIANGFLSIPSSQILYIIVGYFVSRGDINLIYAVIFGTLGNTVGNIILYELARQKGLQYITRFKIFPAREIKKVEIAFRRRGALFLFIGKLLPAIKVFVPIPAGIGKMNRILYAVVIVVSSFIWALLFIAIGYFFGKSKDVFGAYAIILTIISAVVITIFYSYINSEEVTREIEEA
jgi:membrane protein DedA with SNARE-associated domain